MTKESHRSGTIFVDYLCNQSFLESRRGKRIINEHMLLGWLAHQDINLEKTFAHMTKTEFKRQWHLNQCYLDLLQELAPSFINSKISPVLLKGATLLGTIYPELGSRSMSDIDILVHESELSSAIKTLKDAGFKEHKTEKWKANAHKVELIRIQNSIELVVEIHTSLFYHTQDPKWETLPHTLAPYSTLAPEHFLIFQCAHLGFQHSFLKIFWILDIHYWLSQNKELNESEILKQAREFRVYNSLVFTLYILDKYFSTPLGPLFSRAIKKISPVKKKIFSLEFIIEPKRSMPHYLIVKHLCKDSLKEGLQYNFGWIKNKLSSSKE